jgi:urease accessory protein
MAQVPGLAQVPRLIQGPGLAEDWARLAEGPGLAEGWARLDAEFDARTPSEATRAASRQLGAGLRRLLRSMLPGADLVTPWARCGPPAPHHPLVLGAGVPLAGGPRVLAPRAAALAACSGPASAAVRLLGLDPLATAAMLTRLAPDIDHAAELAARSADGPPGSLPCEGAPALDLLADVHLTAEVRLFAS